MVHSNCKYNSYILKKKNDTGRIQVEKSVPFLFKLKKKTNTQREHRVRVESESNAVCNWSGIPFQIFYAKAEIQEQNFTRD